jgi:hypothetical protein
MSDRSDAVYALGVLMLIPGITIVEMLRRPADEENTLISIMVGGFVGTIWPLGLPYYMLVRWNLNRRIQ